MPLIQLITEHEIGVRLGFFLGIFSIMALWELKAPRRPLTVSKSLRWTNNIALVIFNSLVLRLIFPAAAVGVAAFAHINHWGLLNHFSLPITFSVLLSIIALDLVIYLQHVMVHAVPTLWRLHRVHHADPDFDVTTGSRFHPIEITLSMIIKFATIAVLGPPIVAVIILSLIHI